MTRALGQITCISVGPKSQSRAPAMLPTLSCSQSRHERPQPSEVSSCRTYLSPFTKDIRGEDQSDESHHDFSEVPLLWGNNSDEKLKLSDIIFMMWKCREFNLVFVPPLHGLFTDGSSPGGITLYMLIYFANFSCHRFLKKNHITKILLYNVPQVFC